MNMMQSIINSRTLTWMETVKDPFNTKSVKYDQQMLNTKTHCFVIHNHNKVENLNLEINLLTPFDDISQYTEMFRITAAGVIVEELNNSATIEYSYLSQEGEVEKKLEILYQPLSSTEFYFRSNEIVNNTHILKLNSVDKSNFQIHTVQHVEIIPKSKYSIMFK